MERLPDMMSRAVVGAARRGQTDEHGWIHARLPIESLTNAEASFLQLGADVEVIEPVELRERQRRTAAALATLYANAAVDPSVSQPQPAGVLVASS